MSFPAAIQDARQRIEAAYDTALLKAAVGSAIFYENGIATSVLT